MYRSVGLRALFVEITHSPKLKPFYDITAEEFESRALELFRYQAEKCAPYAEWIRLMGVAPESVERVEQIPFVPVELFKTQKFYSGEGEPAKVFTSSNTGGTVPSSHYMASLENYEQAFVRGFEKFYGSVEGWSFYGLLPSYLERDGSSLIYMVDGLIRRGRGGGFYLYDHEKLLTDMAADNGPKVLIGVTYALLDLAERAPKLGDCVVMETGGMKGKRKELSKSELHKVLTESFGVERIHSEYGMAELTSQAYSTGEGIFRTPDWMRVLVRDAANPTDVKRTGRGGINIIDLASRDSVAFIATGDVGTVADNGSFVIEGRIAHSDIRGCNLLVQ